MLTTNSEAQCHLELLVCSLELPFPGLSDKLSSSCPFSGLLEVSQVVSWEPPADLTLLIGGDCTPPTGQVLSSILRCCRRSQELGLSSARAGKLVLVEADTLHPGESSQVGL